MPGLVPGISRLALAGTYKHVDGRDRPGHDKLTVADAISQAAYRYRSRHFANRSTSRAESAR